MDYPDTDEMNFSKDAKDLNEYCSFHELHFQDFDHQGMMTDQQDLIERPEDTKEIQFNNLEQKMTKTNSINNSEPIDKSKLTLKSNPPDMRETPSGFI